MAVKVPVNTKIEAQEKVKSKSRAVERTVNGEVPFTFLEEFTGGYLATVVRSRDTMSFIYDVARHIYEYIYQEKEKSPDILVNYIEHLRMVTMDLSEAGIGRKDFLDAMQKESDRMGLSQNDAVSAAAGLLIDHTISNLTSPTNNKTFLPGYNERTSSWRSNYGAIYEQLLGYGCMTNADIRKEFPGSYVIINIFSGHFLEPSLDTMHPVMDRFNYLHSLRTVGDDRSIHKGKALSKHELIINFFLDPAYTQIPSSLSQKIRIWNHPVSKQMLEVVYSFSETTASGVTHPVESVAKIYTPTLPEANSFYIRSMLEDGKEPSELISEYYRSISTRSRSISHISLDKFPDLGGMDLFKRKVETYIKYAENAGSTKRGRSILLVGVQGAGKTMSAMYTAKRLGRDLYRFDISRVLSGLQGSSEQNMDTELALLENLGDIVLLIDEVEKIFGGVVSSHATDGGVLLRVMEKVLHFLEGNKSNLFIIMTANNIKNLPAELTRTGRVDSIMFVDFPSQEELANIINIHAQNELGDRLKLSKDECDKLAEMLLGRCPYNGADVREIFRYVSDKAILTGEDPTLSDIVEGFIDVQPNYEKHKEKIEEVRENGLKLYEPASSRSEGYVKHRTAVVENLRDKAASIKDKHLKQEFEKILGRKKDIDTGNDIDNWS